MEIRALSNNAPKNSSRGSGFLECYAKPAQLFARIDGVFSNIKPKITIKQSTKLKYKD